MRHASRCRSSYGPCPHHALTREKKPRTSQSISYRHFKVFPRRANYLPATHVREVYPGGTRRPEARVRLVLKSISPITSITRSIVPWLAISSIESKIFVQRKRPVSEMKNLQITWGSDTAKTPYTTKRRSILASFSSC